VAIAPGEDGHEYYVDKDGKVLGQVTPQPARKQMVDIDKELPYGNQN
jgi:hypothetical protein